MIDSAPVILGGAAVAAVAASLAMTERLVRRGPPARATGARLIVIEWVTGAGAYTIIGLFCGDWIGAACVGSALMAGANAARTDLTAGVISDLASLVILVAGAIYASWAQSHLSLLESAAGGVLAGGILLLALAIVRLRSGLSGLGSGDLLLGVAAGFWTGYGGVGYALLLAVAVTSAYGFVRKAGGATRLPFAPGLVSGFGIVAVWQGLS